MIFSSSHLILLLIAIYLSLFSVTSEVSEGDRLDDLAELQSLKWQLADLKTVVQTVLQGIDTTGHGGATYVRWGRTICPTINEQVYTGFAAGSYFTHPGGATNYLCAPNDPSKGSKAPPLSNYLYGVEYETNDFGTHSHNQNVPCVVCRSNVSYTALMIPARSSCYPTWTKAYSGILAAGYGGYPGPSEYICVDHSVEYLPHGEADQNGKLVYPVTSHCGSLSCPPYKENVELPCVVCLK